jgi:hypothetical protein
MKNNVLWGILASILLISCVTYEKKGVNPMIEEVEPNFSLDLAPQFEEGKLNIIRIFENLNILYQRKNKMLYDVDTNELYKLEDLEINIDPVFIKTQEGFEFNVSGNFALEPLSEQDKTRKKIKAILINFSGKYITKTNDNIDQTFADWFRTNNFEENGSKILILIDRLQLIIYNESVQLVIDKLKAERAIEKKWEEILELYDVNNYILFSNIISNDHIGKIGIISRWNERVVFHSKTAMVIKPNDASIFSAKQNLYIFQREYFFVDPYIGSGLIKDVAIFVVEDNLDLIKIKETKVYPNANGPDIKENIYFLPNNILVKYAGKTNVSLTNGRLISVPLFKTINFNTDDPNK